jgi:hypothetical protein
LEKNRASDKTMRIAPAKKVIKPGPGSWRLPTPYFRERKTIPVAAASQKRLEDWSVFLIYYLENGLQLPPCPLYKGG